MLKIYQISLIACCLMLILGSCQNKKFLKAHSHPEKKRQRVYEELWVAKNSIEINSKKVIAKNNKSILCEDSVLVPTQSYNLPKGLENELYYGMSYTIRQKPNKKLFFWRPLLSIYNRADTLKVKYVYDRNYKYSTEAAVEKVGGYRADTVYTTKVIEGDSIYYKEAKLRRFFMNKVGEPPSIFNPLAAKSTARSMQNYLIQRGYLDAVVGYTVDTVRRNRAKVTYHYSTGSPLLIDTVIYESEDPEIHKILKEIKAQSVLKKNKPISKSSFLAEKNRITYAIRNRGYQKFIPNYIAFEADTVNVRESVALNPNSNKMGKQGEKRASIYVSVLPYSDTLIEHSRYSINDVYIVLDEPNIEIHKIRRRYLMDSSFVVLNPPRRKQEVDFVINSTLTEGDSLSYLGLKRKNYDGRSKLINDIRKEKAKSVLVIAGGKYPYWIQFKKQKIIHKNIPRGELKIEDGNEFTFVFPHKEGKTLSLNAEKHKFWVNIPVKEDSIKYVVSLKPYKRRFVRSSYPQEHMIQTGDIPIQVVLRRPAKTAIRDSVEAAKAIAKLKKENFIIRDPVISRTVLVTKGSIYNYDAGRETINRITALDVFKFPRLEYVPSKSGKADELDAYVFMRKADRHHLQPYVEFNTSNANLGWALNLNYRNRNLFKGAEAFVFNVEAGVDFRLNNIDTTNAAQGIIRWINLLDINSNASIYFPKILGFRNWSLSVENPKSKVTLSYRYLQQAYDFRVSSFDALFGYEWTVKNRQHSFSWNPLMLNFTLQPFLQDEFSRRLEASNIALWLSLQERYFIPGSNFSYSRGPKNPNNNHLFYFRFFAEATGNSAWLTDQLIGANELSFWGIPYSQYAKVDVDLRYTWHLNKNHTIASRLMVGGALPFGNSTRVPYARQFFLGGPSSMRAWNMRYLGPGRVKPEAGAEFQLGDLRLEMNAEYRFNLNSWIGGAIFTDIGNIWLTQNPPQSTVAAPPNALEENGVIDWDFYQELAMDVGLGARFDMSFFVLRLDLAWQVHDPSGFLTNFNGGTQQIGQNGLPVYWKIGPVNWVLAVGYPF
jgi:outer membrane protein assembly factor BamA